MRRLCTVGALTVACAGPVDTTLDTTADTGVEPLGCPDFSEVARFPVANPALNEVSGLALGGDGVVWTHNDSGDTARLFAMSLTGGDLGEVRLADVVARDWEDMARATLPGLGATLIVADLGDNNRNRTDGSLVLVPEPAAPGEARSTTVRSAVVIPTGLSDGPQDVEAIAVDPLDGTLLVLSKSLAGSSVYVAGPGWWTEPSLTLQRERFIAFGEPPLDGSPTVTGADIRGDGGAVIVRTYAEAWWFRRALTPSPSPVADAFDSEPCRVPAPLEQGEAIAFVGDDYLTVPESSRPELLRFSAE